MGAWLRMASARLRPAGFDDLGLQRALSDRLLPFLVAAMAFLAALGLAGAFAAAGLAAHWQEGAEAALTVQVPDPTAESAKPGLDRLDQTLALLRADPAVATARPLSAGELNALLRPWLGDDETHLALPLPAVIAVHLTDPAAPLDQLSAMLTAAAPGTVVESHGIWVRRLAALARSLQACAAVALLVVAAVAVAVVAVATHAGIAARREAIEIVHGLGASDGYIAARFAGRATRLAAIGAAAGALTALPVLLTLAGLAAPFGRLDVPGVPSGVAAAVLAPAGLPVPLWLALPLLPVIAAAIGYLTAQVTVRSWLRRLP
jgi:cell division transport system permease protein